jgi:squalene synthase HpnC
MNYGSERATVRQVAEPDDVGLTSRAAAGRSESAAADENFTVASRLLPRSIRRDLSAVYGVARSIDDLGDDAHGDRLALLDDYEADLRRVWSAADPVRPELRRLLPTVRERSLSMQPFLNLLAANRLDQTQTTYPSWSDLRHYCTLSADPVGHIVLEIFGVSTAERIALSDDVCTALQVLEHCQDVGEDRRRGRIYLPQDELARFGVDASDLDRAATSAALRGAVAHQVDRATTLLDSGVPLVRSLRGLGRWAVAGYVAGGRATADALRRHDYDVLSPGIGLSPRRRDTARHALALVTGR